MDKKILNDTILGKISRIIFPNWSYCSNCGKTWKHCKNKTVKTSEFDGTFATCDKCWDKLSLEDLKICYTETYQNQERCSIKAGYTMDYILEHLLECVEKEFKETRG